MITVPVYELLLLPGVTFFFKKDMFPKGKITEDNIGEEILFVMQKEEMPPEEISMETIYPVGVLGTIDSIDEEGSIKVTTKCRVQVTSVEYSENEVLAEATDRPDVMDVSEEEEKDHQLPNQTPVSSRHHGNQASHTDTGGSCKHSLGKGGMHSRCHTTWQPQN